MSNKDKDLEELIDDAKRQKWGHRTTKEGHAQLFAPDGKGIVVFAGTPSDRRSFDNSLAEMKRLGYQLPDDRAQLMQKRKSHGVKREVIEYFRTHPTDVIETGALITIIRGKLGVAVPDNTVFSALASLAVAETVTRVTRGYYRWNPDSPLSKSLPQVKPPPPPPPVAPKLFDPDAIDDEKILDEALVALSRVEGIVRKYRGIIHQATELRRALGVKAGGS